MSATGAGAADTSTKAYKAMNSVTIEKDCILKLYSQLLGENFKECVDWQCVSWWILYLRPPRGVAGRCWAVQLFAAMDGYSQ